MKVFLSFIITLLFTFSALAQDRRPSNTNIEAMKAAFITGQLNLTTEEAQRFWPVYNKFQSEMNNLYEQKRKNYDTNKDFETAVTMDLDLDGKILYTKRRYYSNKGEFSHVISIQKVAALYQSESKFREYLYKQLGNNHDGDKKDGDHRYDDRKKQ